MSDDSNKYYKIPISLDRNILDQEINLSTSSYNISAIPVKIIALWIFSFISFFWVCANTFVASSNLGYKVILGILWVIGTFLLVGYTNTKELSLSKIPVLLEYIPKSARYVTTRKSSNPNHFYSIVNIKHIDDDGLVYWSDSTIGYFYFVVGCASILLFDRDRNTIINRVDSFFRKINPDVEYQFITTKKPQKVYRQLANLDKLNLNLADRDPELLYLMNETFEILRDHVGHNFTSIHQYMTIKAPNAEVLMMAHNNLSDEVSNSSYMFKQVVRLSRQDIHEILSQIYSSKL